MKPSLLAFVLYVFGGVVSAVGADPGTLPPRQTCFVPMMAFRASPLTNQPMAVRDTVSGCATAGVAYGDPQRRLIVFNAQDACRKPDGSAGPLLSTLFFEAQLTQTQMLSHPSPDAQCAYESPVGAETIGHKWDMNPSHDPTRPQMYRERN
jgi:hypothetical protein